MVTKYALTIFDFCFVLYRLCEIKPGDVVCDPMCGSGSISIQVSLPQLSPGAEVLKLFMLNSAEHEIYPAHKY